MRFSLHFAFAASCLAGQLDVATLQTKLDGLGKSIDGRVGICVRDADTTTCVRGAERFSLQSVMKLVVGIAVLDAVDHRGWKLEDPVLVRKQDLSLFVQPISKLVGESGYQTTVGDLVRRAIVDSDSAAVDILIAKLGGIEKVQAFLNRKKIAQVRLDRDERHLQTQIGGIDWRPEFVDAAVLDQAFKAVPEDRQAAAYTKYQKDPRDTATPLGMTQLLQDLALGKLVSKSSTAFLMRVMEETVTFPDRLKAGLAPGWKLGHKTGSSSSWKGLTVATNDVGVMTAPDGRQISVVVFVADSRATLKEKAVVMSGVSRAVCESYR
ncbi:class A beta-lactamase [Bryobacter aggregatus]|uniref:class A beta-lactamase n=1 Tax=Bryobacter aggregatus TaxID=360054 RepID=UPI000563C606|nr:class A beta-lactamase [Bryobacter aggregatus]